MHMSLRAYAYVHAHAHAPRCVHVCMCVHVCVCVRARARARVCVCFCVCAFECLSHAITTLLGPVLPTYESVARSAIRHTVTVWAGVSPRLGPPGPRRLIPSRYFIWPRRIDV